jgi:hypothetical protein
MQYFLSAQSTSSTSQMRLNADMAHEPAPAIKISAAPEHRRRPGQAS